MRSELRITDPSRFEVLTTTHLQWSEVTHTTTQRAHEYEATQKQKQPGVPPRIFESVVSVAISKHKLLVQD